jgi:hypothetical protein
MSVMGRFTTVLALSCVTGAWALGGCSSRGADEVEWARAALARNPNIEVVSVDEKAGVFTVKDSATGEIRTLRVDEIAAAPASASANSVAGMTAATPATAAATDSPDTNNTPVAPGETATPAESEATAPAELPAEIVSPAAPAVSATPDGPSAGGRVVAAGPGYSITRGGESPKARATDSAALSPPPAEPTRSEPIICQGQRFMRIDGRSLESSTDAIVAENGCDLHITNARIRANGVAIVVRNARVHVTNSTITGGSASIEASGTAEVFASSTTFAGVTRRFDAAVVNDLGGNNFN